MINTHYQPPTNQSKTPHPNLALPGTRPVFTFSEVGDPICNSKKCLPASIAHYRGNCVCASVFNASRSYVKHISVYTQKVYNWNTVH